MMVFTILLIVPLIMAKGNYDHNSTHYSSSLDEDQHLFHAKAIYSEEEMDARKRSTCEKRCRFHFHPGTKAYEICMEVCVGGGIPKTEIVARETECEERCKSHFHPGTKAYEICMEACRSAGKSKMEEMRIAKCVEECSHFGSGTKPHEICMEACGSAGISKMEEIIMKCKEGCSHFGSEMRDNHRCMAECWISNLFELAKS